MLRYCALIFVVLGAVRGCSEPEGGFVEPTDAEIVFHANYVVIGKVTKIIRPDPVIVYDSTYGAQLQISCQYKGENIARNITIIGAGFIPGHCTANDLKMNMEYILFLSKTDSGYFQQTSSARNSTDIKQFLKVCDLVLKYPIGINSDFPSVRCSQVPLMTTPCERYNPPVDRPAIVAPPSPAPKSTSHPPEHVENVQIADQGVAQKGQITTTPSGADANHFFSFVLVFAIVIQAFVFL